MQAPEGTGVTADGIVRGDLGSRRAAPTLRAMVANSNPRGAAAAIRQLTHKAGTGVGLTRGSARVGNKRGRRWVSVGLHWSHHPIRLLGVAGSVAHYKTGSSWFGLGARLCGSGGGGATGGGLDQRMTLQMSAVAGAASAPPAEAEGAGSATPDQNTWAIIMSMRGSVQRGEVQRGEGRAPARTVEFDKLSVRSWVWLITP